MSNMMDFEVDRIQLREAFDWLGGLRPRGGRVVMLRPQGDELELTIADSDIGNATWATLRLPCKTSVAGAAAVRFTRVLGLVRVMEGESVRIASEGDKFIRIRGGGSAIKMRTADFPESPTAPETMVELRSLKLADLIGKTLFSVSTDEARVNLNGALFESNGKTATMVSTDGHRLTKCSVPLEGPEIEKVVIPRKGLVELSRALCVIGSCGVGLSDGHMFVDQDQVGRRVTLTMKLKTATFPPWETIVPKGRDHRVTVNRERMISALRQAAVIGNGNGLTKIEVGTDSLRISAEDVEGNEIEIQEVIVVEGEPFVTAFNARYLIEALVEAVTTEHVTMDFEAGDLQPCVLRPVEDDSVASEIMSILMPMRWD